MFRLNALTIKLHYLDFQPKIWGLQDMLVSARKHSSLLFEMEILFKIVFHIYAVVLKILFLYNFGFLFFILHNALVKLMCINATDNLHITITCSFNKQKVVCLFTMCGQMSVVVHTGFQGLVDQKTKPMEEFAKLSRTLL